MGDTKNADNRWWPALTITLIYAAVGAGWILVSDQLLTLIVRDAETITRLQTVKGWFYVLATAALLFWLIRRQLNAIHEKESYNRVLFEESMIGLVLSRMNGELVDINPAYSRIIGRSIDECLNLTYRDITPEKYAEDDLRQLQILEKTGRYGPYEKEYIHKDGHQVSVRLSGMMLEKEGEHFIWSSAEDISERKRATKALEESEERLEKSMKAGGIGAWDWNINTGDLTWSDETYRIFGFTPSGLEPSYEQFIEMVHPDDRILVSNAVEASLDNNKPYSFDLRVCRRDGDIRIAQTQGEVIVDESGKPVRMLGTFKDITEHKQAEDALRESEESLAEAQRMAHIGNWALDLITNQLEWSDEIYRIFEIDPRKFGASYEAFLDAIHPDDRERVNTAYTESVKNKTPYSFVHRLRMPDGTVKHVHESCEIYYDHEGNPLRSVGTVQDITEQYLTEQSLKRVNRSLRALSACNEVVIRSEDEAELLDKVCRIIVDIPEYQLAWVGLVEHDKAKTIRPVAQVGYEDGYLDTLKLTWADTELGKGPTGTAIRTGRASVIRNIMQDPRYAPWRESAQKRGYRSSISLPLNDKEQTFGTLNIYADEEDAFDEEEMRLLQELADDLAYGIASLRSHKERHQLNRQLQQSQKMEAIGQLTGGIAHDFNNMLASILGFTGLALQRFVKDDQPKLREYLNEVTHAGERARDLVSQMLAFGRKGSSKASLLQIAPMIKEVTKMLQVTLPSTIQISSHTAADLPKVMIAPVQLHQILMNICINARDAIGAKGRIDIRVEREKIVQGASMDGVPRNICASCQHEIDDGDYVVLSIQDSGSGISDETLSRIFEPFFTTKEVGKGSGLGLSMVHGILHEHGGHILVDTQIGIGTTIRLLMPVGEEVSAHDPEAELNISQITEGLNGARILIVDDEKSIAIFMGDLFESHGGKVTVMTDSQAALALFIQEPTAFDLIITDQTMPQLTGVELAQKILALRPELPVILCTGYSERVDEAKAMALGIRGYITKPMDVDTLFNRVYSLLG